MNGPQRPLVGHHAGRQHAGRGRGHAVTPARPSARRRSSMQLGERRACGSRPADQHQIDARDRRAAQQQPGGFLQPAAGTVANHGVADLLRHGETEPAGPSSPRQRLQHQPGSRHLAALRGDAQELGAPLQALRRGPPCPRPVRPTAACGPWRGDWPAPCGRRRSPCGRGSRAGACGPASTVDRCASRHSPIRHSGPPDPGRQRWQAAERQWRGPIAAVPLQAAAYTGVAAGASTRGRAPTERRRGAGHRRGRPAGTRPLRHVLRSDSWPLLPILPLALAAARPPAASPTTCPGPSWRGTRRRWSPGPEAPRSPRRPMLAVYGVAVVLEPPHRRVVQRRQRPAVRHRCRGGAVGSRRHHRRDRAVPGERAPRLRRAARRGGPDRRIRPALERDGFLYLLAMRLVPALPFWVVNLAPALVGMRLAALRRRHLIGIMPATFVFAGSAMGWAARWPQGGQPDLSLICSRRRCCCRCCGLAALSLLPVAWRHWRARHG